MKNVYSFIFFNVLIVGCGTTLFGQTGFDVKKHKKIDVNTSSLNAGHTNGAKSNSNGRSITSGTIVKNSRQLMRPIAGQPGPKVHYSKETGLPSFIVSNGNRIGSSIPGARKDSRAATFEYLTELKDVLQVENPDETFFIDNISVGKDSKTHVRMSQLYHGVPVYGSEVVVHLNASGTGEAFNGKYINIKDKIEVIPAISNQVAVQRVSSNLQQRTRLHALSKDERRLVEFADPKVTLCIYQDKGLVKSSVLAYHIIYYPSILERWEYFVDATTGSVLHQFESTCGADGPRTATGTDLNGVSRSINTYQIGTSFILIDASRVMFNPAASTFPDEPAGGIMTIDMNNTFGDDQTVKHVVSANNAWTNQTQARALSAHFNAGIAYEYFRSKHNRPSIDGDNGTIISIVNVPDEDGTALDNAFWNGKAMFYGNGKNEFKPLAGAMDVAGHELTHGVVQNTANLEYQGESGAINESMADVFGTMMDPADWTLGEDVVKIASFPSGALRSMSDPHNGGTSLSSPGYQPSHTDEQYKGTQDNGGVHINSGIPNHAFYLYATAITRDKAAAVYYKALSENLTKSSQFIDLRLAVIKAATDLYGAASNEVTQAGIAFDAVGISDGDGGDYTPTLPNNPGTEYLLIYNTTTSNPKTLYRTTADNPTNNPVALTDIEFLSRPSVTDQGDVAVFVADDHTIHVIETTPGSVATERILQDEEIWSNVVVSKGGSKIAAVTSGQDAKIWVYDFGLDDWNSFDLYNPTYSEGVTTAGPLYADALEWDYTGQYLVYDCFNQIDNASDPNAIAIEYWDVNFIHVWDNAAKNFADGTIEKLFSSLPDGVSIGNPSFAKNSPNVLAFDYVNEKTEEYQIVGCNIETNDVKSIVENNTLGWPSYNKTDQRLAFTTTGSVDDYDAHYITLAADKISPSAATSTLLIDGAKWPVYFAFGERSTGDEVIEIVTDVPEEIGKESLVECYPNPVQKEVVIQTGDPTLLSGKIVIVNSIGQQVYSMPVQALDDKHAIVDVEHLKTGQYFMRISGARKSAGCTLYKK